MATMTMAEANAIVNLLIRGMASSGEVSPSRFGGMEIPHICTAIKLQIANEFLIWSQTGQLEEKFAKKVNFWAQAPFVLKMAYAAEARRAKRTFNFDDPGILAMETEESFGKFCQSIGYGDPIFWQKIYTRLRLEYTESSPRGNLPTDPETGLQ